MHPPFEKGNKFSVGHGSPKKYTQEFLDEELKAFKEWMKKKDSVYYKYFCTERGYSSKRLYEFAEDHAGFAETMSSIKEWQEARLAQFGLFRKTDAGISKFLLSAVHGIKEEKEEALPDQHYHFHSDPSPNTPQPETTPEL